MLCLLVRNELVWLSSREWQWVCYVMESHLFMSEGQRSGLLDWLETADAFCRYTCRLLFIKGWIEKKRDQVKVTVASEGLTSTDPQMKLPPLRQISLITSHPIKPQKEFDSLPGCDSVWLRSRSNIAQCRGRGEADYDPSPLSRSHWAVWWWRPGKSGEALTVSQTAAAGR